ncbi:MAG: DUF3618 domain-containing protein [Caulobacter sp.]
MNRSPEEIEREVEATRGELDRTVEALKDKMSPGQLFDELTSAFKGTGSSDVIGALGAQVGQNPLAVAMIGAGFAWLMLSDKAKPSTDPASAARRDTTTVGVTQGDGGAHQGLSDTMGAAKDKAGEVIGQMKDKVVDAAGAVGHAAQSAGHAIGHSGSRMGEKAAAGFAGLLEREPLVLAGLGLAVGAALGAALPATALEDKAFGKVRDNALEEGRSFAEAGLDKAKHVAGAVYDEVRDEAQQQGLMGGDDGASVVDKAGNVLRRGIDAARADIQSQTN